MAQRKKHPALPPDKRHHRNVALALEYVERAFAADGPPSERARLTALATAIEHGANLDDLAAGIWPLGADVTEASQSVSDAVNDPKPTGLPRVEMTRLLARAAVG